MASVALAAVASCGGGGGGGSSSNNASGSTSAAGQPEIVATVIAFPANHVPTWFAASGNDATAFVTVKDQQGSDISTAVVRINGITLPHTSSGSEGEYYASLNINPGSTISLSVKVDSALYSSAGRMPSAYPTIISPAANATWSTFNENLISWSGAPPSSTAKYAISVFSNRGSQLWPPSGGVQLLDTSVTSFTVPANDISVTGPAAVLVGLVDIQNVPGAAPSSGFVFGGFNFSPIYVDSQPVATLSSIAITPDALMLAPGKSKQLTLTGSYSDGTQQDLTSSATWSSSDTSKVTVNASGLVTGVAVGSAIITAQSNGQWTTGSVSVFQPDPSPEPPLSQSVTFQMNYAHSGFVTMGSSGPVFPPTATWSMTLNGTVSYPIIADGKVIVTTGTNASDPTANGTSLYALDLATGAIAWGPITIPGFFAFSATAYDHGKVFVVNFNGEVRAFDVATGTQLWMNTIPEWTTTPPTAVNGLVYAGGLYAFDEVDGSQIWYSGTGSGKNSPAVSADGVFVSVPCTVYKLDPLVGTKLWVYAGGCEGGGGKTAVYANGKLYTRDYASSPSNQVFDASNGNQLGTFDASTIPAFSSQSGFFLVLDNQTNITTLDGIDVTTGNTIWTFQGDGHLISAPIVIDNVVVIGSSSGTVYALKTSDGSTVWTGSTSTAIEGSDEVNANQLTGLGAGEGWLVVPAGDTVVAWKLVP